MTNPAMRSGITSSSRLNLPTSRSSGSTTKRTVCEEMGLRLEDVNPDYLKCPDLFCQRTLGTVQDYGHAMTCRFRDLDRRMPTAEEAQAEL